MRSRLACASLAVFATALISGCAGGWRHGAAPGAALDAKGSAAPAARAAASPSLPAAGGMAFTYRGAANSVALAGDFNAWSTSADPMTRQADGSWTLVKRLDAGRHLYKFVIDGGTWKEDPSAVEFTDDGYGGKNSVVVVAAGATTPAATGTAPATTPAAGTGRAPVQTAEGGMTFNYKGAANSVALAGDFNAWSTSADPMTRQADGSWTLVKRLEPGRHLYKFVIDGGTWKEDPSASEFADDGYGGKNSVVVVAAGATTPAVTGTVPATTPATGTGRAPVQSADGVTFTYAGPASNVNLAGEFNAWSTTADPMVRQADGTWTITMKLVPGSHAYKFLIDGTAWKQDEANPVSVGDPYGGKNSVVTVK